MVNEAKALTAALDAFYADVERSVQAFQRERQKLDLYEASHFNVFAYIDPDENCISDIFHQLFDALGNHGQGALFLDSFLELVGVSPDLIQRPFRVKREDCTSYCSSYQRRIDITLESTDFGIGVENKPWADEATDQVRDYCTHLRRKYGERFMLVYLSGEGVEPSSLSESELLTLRERNQYKMLSYADVSLWAETCADQCKAEKVRWFLLDFVAYLKGNFTEMKADERPTVHD